MNVCSLSSLKLDALLDEFCDHTLDAALLCETLSVIEVGMEGE